MESFHDLGRKNYLFAGSHESAQCEAVIYSLLATCRIRGVDPFTWLKTIWIHPRLPGKPVGKITPLKVESKSNHFKGVVWRAVRSN